MFPATQRLTIDPDRVVWREVGDEVVILDVTTATYFTLNGTGCSLWAELDDGATPGELADKLVEAYGVGADVAARDVDAFLTELDGRALLRREQ